jgi:hypothetical protein
MNSWGSNRAVALVDEHLQRDAAVDQERGGHARRDRRRVDRRAEVVELHLPLVAAEDGPRPRIADVERRGRGVGRRRAGEERRAAPRGAAPARRPRSTGTPGRRPAQRQACGTPTGTSPQSSASSRRVRRRA